MIRLESVSKQFGAETLFEGLDWHLPQEGSVGLVGPNGAGKTTLFEIMAGELEPDEGRAVVPEAVDVGYLPQEWSYRQGDRSLLEVVLEGAEELISMQQRLEELEASLDRASAEESVELSDEYAELQETFRQRGGYELESNAREIAAGLGFDSDELDRPIRTFSGGWRMRAALGRLLLRHPDVLLLDEPTNHLDLASLEWLEEFLLHYDGTIVTISHDRYFLNALADEIAELAKGTLRIFTGDYDTYRRKRRELRERLAKKAKEQQKERERIQEFVDKFRYNASKASLVQSRLKKLERMEPIDVPEPLDTDVSFEFPQPPRVPKSVVSLTSVSKSYGANRVYDDLDFTLYRGEKVAFVGPNGAGKSTLLKLLAGVEACDSGKRELGRGVEVEFFAQHSLEQLDPADTVFDSMERAASHDAYPKIRPVLGAFGFSDDQVDKQVEVLSGGEKARLALARMLLEPAGCLFFDEPTNHLDIPSCQVLEHALQKFEGAICIISHDRYFLNNVVNRVVHIDDGELTSYKGDYDYYRYKRRGESEASEEEPAEPASETADEAGEGVSRKERRRIRAELREERREETAELRGELERVESRIEELEERQAELEQQLADPSTYDGEADIEKLQREFGEIESELMELMEAWEEKSATLESIRERYEARAEELCS